MADGSFQSWVESELSPASTLTGAELFWVSQGAASKQVDLDTIAAYIGSGATGDVTGPGSATNQAIAIFDGTSGKDIKNSVVTIADTTGNMAGVGTLATGAHTITSTSAASFAVGANGGTNPVFQVDANTGSVATGIKFTGAAAAGGFDMTVLSSGSNENLTINAKGTGTITLGGTSTGAIALSRNTTLAGTFVQTSTSATAFVSGPNGATNPAFVVDNSVSSAATGFSIQSKAAGAGVQMTVISSGTNEGFNIGVKGSGTAGITGGSATQLSVAAGVSLTVSTTQASIINLTRGATANTGFLYTLVASGTGGSSLTAGSEVHGIYFNLATNQTHGSTTAITTQRDMRINPSTHLYQTASGTITDAMGLSIDGAPIASTNCNITTSHALYVGGRAVGSGVAASYGLTVNPNTGATANYGSQLLGLNGLGRGTPTAFADIAASTTASASLRIRSGTAPTSPNEGDMWYDGTDIKFRLSGSTVTFTVT